LLVRAAAIAGLMALPATAAMPPSLSVDGLGGVRVGMTLKQAEKVVGPLSVDYPNGGDDDGGCGDATPKRPWIAGASLMVENRRIVRIDIFQSDKSKPRPTTKTDAGIGIGSTIADVRRAYGKRLIISAHPYEGDQGRYLTIKGLKPDREIIFETNHGRVESFRAGMTQQVDYIEDCL